MSILDTAKDIASLVQKINNVELAKQIVDLQSQLLDLLEQNHGLKDENRQLKERAETKERLSVRKNSYWLGDDGPFCLRCWDAEDRLQRLILRTGYLPMCPKCRTNAPDPDAPPPKPVRRASRPWLG